MGILSFAFLIIRAIAIGMCIVTVASITFNWLREKIRAKLSYNRTKQVIVADLNHMVQNSNCAYSMQDLRDLNDGRNTEVIAGLDEDNQIIGDVEVIKDRNINLDDEVEELLGRDKTVIVEK